MELLNPISPDYAHLRRSLVPSLIREAERNWAAHTRDIRLFEVGTVFDPTGEGRPVEHMHVAGVLSGHRDPPHWTSSGKAPDFDLWDLRGVFDRAVALANPRATVQVEGSGWVARTASGHTVGMAARLTADLPPWAAPLFGFEVRLDPEPDPPRRYRPIPVTPSAERDLALVVPASVSAETILATARKAAGPLVESVTVVDEYRGAGLPSGTRSLAIRVTCRAPDRTLRDEEAENVVRRVREALERDHGVVLRTS